jgi:hypothetical protein
MPTTKASNEVLSNNRNVSLFNNFRLPVKVPSIKRALPNV